MSESEYLIRKAYPHEGSTIAYTLTHSFEKVLSSLAKDMDNIAKTLENGIVTDQFYIAEKDGDMVGIIALADCTGRAVTTTRAECIAHLGFFRGRIAYRVIEMVLMRPHKYPPTTGYIDVVGVMPDARGKGLAKRLLRAVIDDNTRYYEFILDVDSVNSSAVKCYTDFGFVEFKRRRILPFSERGTIYMNYLVSGSDVE
jgi:ribosomal protein S18 acetylase RimI-like enzyme